MRFRRESGLSGKVCLVELILSLCNEIQQGRKKNMLRKLVMAAILGILVTASGAMAQEGRWQEISVQGTGFFTKDSSGNGINQHATDAGGFLISYRYHFNRWLAADGSYGYARNTQQNFSSSGPLSVQANVHQATGALVITVPRRVFKLHPYALAGAGALVFDPTGNRGGFVSGAQSQAKAAFVYGGGADYELTKHFTLRAEYRGFVYERPDFDLATLRSGATTHTAQPSAGIVLRF
jgi:opacity protein-like surface antigen